MSGFVLVSDIVEPNGKTVRQNNMELTHKIPLGTLVEVDIEYSDHHGIRMFVCEHTRDCDGEPLYALYSSDIFSSLEYVKSINNHVYRAMICDGFPESCLTVIRPAKQKSEEKS